MKLKELQLKKALQEKAMLSYQNSAAPAKPAARTTVVSKNDAPSKSMVPVRSLGPGSVDVGPNVQELTRQAHTLAK